MADTTPDLDSLADDGDTIEIDDGRTLRLRVTPDEGPVDMLWSDDSYGAVAWIDSRRYDDYGHAPERPDGFDGNAEKLALWHADAVYWWQPPADVPRGSDGFAKLRTLVRDLLSYGFTSVGLELLDGTDAYGQPIVTACAWLGGIDSLEGGYLAEIVGDLWNELQGEGVTP